MSGTRRPGQPARRPARPRSRRPSRAVFWRRRLVVLGVLLVLVWGVTRVVSGDDAPTAADASDPTPSAAPTRAPSATPTPTAAATPRERTRKERDVQVDLGSASAACDPASLAVQPSVPGGAYAGGAVPVRLAFSTSGSAACTLDLARTDLLVDVAREGRSVWSSRTCPSVVPQRSVQVEPTWSTTVDVTWSGRRGGDACAADEKLLPAGTYQARAAVLGGEPGESEFALRTRPKPKPTPTPTPTASAKPSAKPKPTASPQT